VDHGWELISGNESTDRISWGQLISPNGRQLLIPSSPKGGSRLAKAIRADVELLRRQQETAAYGTSPARTQASPETATEDTTEKGLIVAAFRRLSDGLLHALADNPRLLYGLHWREFEELVADLLSREGLEVSLTPGSGDRGVDIYARHYGPMGATLYVVECKRYGPNRPVGPDLVRLLYGVVERERATKGLLVTSSYFTVEAEREAQEELAYRLALRDGTAVSEWIKSAIEKPSSSPFG
jgi:restriction endonuclease Mrr